MKLPNTSTPDSPKRLSGFTMIETLIVIGLIGFVAVIGVIVGLDTYQRYSVRGDLDRAAVLLQKARSSAINNVDENSYGVRFDDPDNLVLFKGTTYNPSDPYNYRVEKSKSVTYDLSACPTNQVVWSQLFGDANVCRVDIKDGVKISPVTINARGGINY